MKVLSIAAIFFFPAVLAAQTPTVAPVTPAAPESAPAKPPALSAIRPLAPMGTAPRRPLTDDERLRLTWAASNRNKARANVDGTIITFVDVRKGLSSAIPGIQSETKGNEQAFEQRLNATEVQIVQRMSDQKLMLREFSERGGALPSAYVNARVEEKIQLLYSGDRTAYLNVLKQQGLTPMEDKRNIEEEIILNILRNEVLKPSNEVGPKKILEFYKENMDKVFKRTEQVRFRQIRLTPGATESNADIQTQVRYIQSELARGIAFAQLVKLTINKDSQRTEDGGGNVWVEASNLNEKVVATLKALPDEGISAPLDFTQPNGRTEIYFLQRVGYRPAGAMPLEEVQDLIIREIAEREQNKAFEEWVSRLRKKYFVRYY
ncbi:MAG: SurA N-terminal domain-containing protein [Puniceicoccales bacterium]|jgi:parvulin-like peptidyl-prolyl isomerase|nr:SurA N-terminal domain-containing protein [Puniceicoccales bacterium]